MFDTVRNGAIVVAHPDDETLWAGGLIASFPGAWTVIACSIPKSDPIRAWKFFDACAALDAKARLLPYPENPGRLLDGLNVLDLTPFDVVVTHNANGEYGHPHHVQVHRAVTALAPDKSFTFGWSAGALRLPLTPAASAAKRRALECYDHVSPNDGQPKWIALLDRYRTAIDFTEETFDRHR